MSGEQNMNWTCEQTEAQLSDYLDGLLQPSEFAALQSHAASCDRCAPLLSTVSQLVGSMHELEELETPPRLVYNILDKTLGPRDTVVTAPGFFGWLRTLGMPRLAYGALSVSATFLMIASVSGFSWKHPKLADLQPANIARNADRQAHLVFARGTKFVSDLRVVYEIQTRLRQDNNEIPNSNEEPAPQQNQAPGRTDGSKPGSPKQQNRATSFDRNLQLVATTFTSRACQSAVFLNEAFLNEVPLLAGTASGRRTR
jgi:anti-sigma factor RsiW